MPFSIIVIVMIIMETKLLAPSSLFLNHAGDGVVTRHVPPELGIRTQKRLVNGPVVDVVEPAHNLGRELQGSRRLVLGVCVGYLKGPQEESAAAEDAQEGFRRVVFVAVEDETFADAGLAWGVSHTRLSMVKETREEKTYHGK